MATRSPSGVFSTSRCGEWERIPDDGRWKRSPAVRPSPSISTSWARLSPPSPTPTFRLGTKNTLAAIPCEQLQTDRGTTKHNAHASTSEFTNEPPASGWLDRVPPVDGRRTSVRFVPSRRVRPQPGDPRHRNSSQMARHSRCRLPRSPHPVPTQISFVIGRPRR